MTQEIAAFGLAVLFIPHHQESNIKDITVIGGIIIYVYVDM